MGTYVRAALAALGITAVLAGCAAHAAAPVKSGPLPATVRAVGSTPAITVQYRTTTYRADGTLAVTVARTLSGSCFVATIEAAPAADAYRCISGSSALLDPCVAAPGDAHPTVLACRTDPWSPATLLRLTAPLPPAQQPIRATRPWAMQLAGGQRCVAVTGTVMAVHGLAPVYTCANGARATAPQSSGTGVWHADLISSSSVVTRGVAITGIWRL